MLVFFSFHSYLSFFFAFVNFFFFIYIYIFFGGGEASFLSEYAHELERPEFRPVDILTLFTSIYGTFWYLAREVTLKFLGANAPLGTASSEGLYVCLYVYCMSVTL